MIGLAEFATKLGVSYTGAVDALTQEEAREAVGALLAAMEDYATDERGDVGSWVREAAMRGLEVLCHCLVTADAARPDGAT